MSSRVVSGTFDVTVKPISSPEESVMRMSIDKVFHGPLEATSVGQMIAGGVEANGSRVYVALETVTGTLDGRQGSFVLAHRGTMTRGGSQLSVVIAPESGTGDLSGISGDLTIEIVDKVHHYAFAFALPPS